MNSAFRYGNDKTGLVRRRGMEHPYQDKAPMVKWSPVLRNKRSATCKQRTSRLPLHNAGSSGSVTGVDTGACCGKQIKRDLARENTAHHVVRDV